MELCVAFADGSLPELQPELANIANGMISQIASEIRWPPTGFLPLVHADRVISKKGVLKGQV
jgi:hypothetical protein